MNEPSPSTVVCPECGRSIESHQRAVRLNLPDPVLEIPEGERAARTWGGEPLLMVQGVGAFVRVLIDIRLKGGRQTNIRTWLAIDPNRMREVYDRWEDPSYRDLVLDGYLANSIPPWGRAVLGAPATARVRSVDEIPHIEASPNGVLAEILTTDWDHEFFMAPYASLFE